MDELLVERRTLADYLAAGGGRGLSRAQAMSPAEVIAEVQRSGLRGRGGAGFPTGKKWESVTTGGGGGTRYVIANGAEGEPATFKDRLLMRRNPFQVLEGVAIASYAVEAPVAYVGVKESDPAAARMAAAIDDMQAAGLFGETSVELVLGPDRYLFGEETGLIGVIEGRGPFPRVVRPFMHGPFAKTVGDNPTVENNVETLANVPSILANGPDWLRSRGTPDSPGSMLFTVCGDVEREGVFELEMGTPLRHLVVDLAGAADVQVIVPGASNAVILSSGLDVPMDFESLRRAGTGLGSAGFCVFDSTACIVDIARAYARFLYVESCAQCPSCKNGSEVISTAFDALHDGSGTPGDVDVIARWADQVTDGQKCALPTGEQVLVRSILQSFADDLREHATQRCASERDVLIPKIAEFDEEALRFVYDVAYRSVDPQWPLVE
jgi:NADH:ubiquinone oxidoreductase subunit F (NADH-binding)